MRDKDSTRGDVSHAEDVAAHKNELQSGQVAGSHFSAARDLPKHYEAERKLLIGAEVSQEKYGKHAWQISRLGPYLIGIAAAFSVMGFYLGLLTLTSSLYNAWMEFKAYAEWIVALAVGLGVQATLFLFLRKKLRGENLKGAKCSLAASGGMSTSAMAACCAHYLVNILPVLSLPFLSAAAASLALYQTHFFMAGVISNVVGIGLMLRMMKKNGIISAEAFAGLSNARLRWMK